MPSHKLDFNGAFSLLLNYIVLPFVCVSFCLTSLTNDTRIFLAAEEIADRYYSLPYGWDAAYEVKPIGNRIINWVIYKVANAVVPMYQNDYTEFGWMVKLTALIILLLFCWYISKRIQFLYGFPVLVIAFSCQANFGIMMSEWFSVLFSLVCVAMAFEENKNWQVIAGAGFIVIGLLKGITCFMLLPAICAVYLLGKNIEWKKAIAGYIAGGVAYLILCLTVWPYSLGDILLSRYIAHVGMHSWTTLLKYFWITQDQSWLPRVLAYYLPFVLAGILLAFLVFMRYYAKEDRKGMALFAFMWLVPIAIIFTQNEFIVYHYLVLLFPAIVTYMIYGKVRT